MKFSFCPAIFQSWEAVCKGQKDGKVFPLFNQLKTPYGLISSADPRLFDPNVGLHAGAVLDKDIRQRLPDENRTLDILLSLTRGPVFEMDWRERKRDFIGGEGNTGKDSGVRILTGEIGHCGGDQWLIEM